MPSTCGMSTRTTSPSSLLTAQWAQVAPTFPAPMMLILARRMTTLASFYLTRLSVHAFTGADRQTARSPGPCDYRERASAFNQTGSDGSAGVAGCCATWGDSVSVPHSGDRPRGARRSYPQWRHRPARWRARVRTRYTSHTNGPIANSIAGYANGIAIM